MITVGLHILKLWGSKMIGIISYLPNDEKIRSKRLQFIKRLISELREWFKTETIHIVSQNYSENDYNFTDDKLLFHKFEKGIGVANARNEILKLFYNSDDDVLVLSDDDIKLYNYYNIKELIIRFYNNEINVDLITGLDASMSPFKQLNIKNDVCSYFTLKPITSGSSFNFMMLKKPNKKYFYNQKLIDVEISEDLAFISQLLSDGLKLYTCINLIKCQNLTQYSTLFSDDEIIQKHHELMTNFNNYIKDKYNFDDYKSLIKYYTSFYSQIKVRRNVKYEIIENDIPIKRIGKIKEIGLNNSPLFL